MPRLVSKRAVKLIRYLNENNLSFNDIKQNPEYDNDGKLDITKIINDIKNNEFKYKK